MKGVIAGRAPGVAVVDVTHGIPPQDVLAGALVLRHAVPWFPAGTVHVAVVDPGVGSARRPLCVETDDALLVGPDNGLLSLAAARVRRVIELREERFFLSPRSDTFHGRDVFAPVAAALATGTDPGELGPTCTDMTRLHVPEPRREGTILHGQVVYVDHFGNLVTNVSATALPRGARSITIGPVRLAGIAPAYANAAPGAAVAVINSWGLLEVAVRDGSAGAVFGLAVGAPIVIEPVA